MTTGYDLLIAGPLDFGRLPAVLATLAEVAIDAVDVADQDVMARNWEAAVLCTYRPSSGDISWVLDLYVSDAAGTQPTVDEAAAQLADSLRVPVLYGTDSSRPSSYWLASPDGPRTRARLYAGPDDQGDGSVLTIDAVERPVGLLPHVRVALQPEVIKDVLMDTPVRDAFENWLGAEGLIPELGDALWKATTRLGAWESLTVRMTSGWPPDGWYPAADYRDDLITRDELAGDLGLSAPVAQRFAVALEQVDEVFRANTRATEDAGARGWWWGRVPQPVPWPAEAAAQ
jgi:hypothetical protein